MPSLRPAGPTTRRCVRSTPNQPQPRGAAASRREHPRPAQARSESRYRGRIPRCSAWQCIHQPRAIRHYTPNRGVRFPRRVPAPSGRRPGVFIVSGRARLRSNIVQISLSDGGRPCHGRPPCRLRGECWSCVSRARMRRAQRRTRRSAPAVWPPDPSRASELSAGERVADWLSPPPPAGEAATIVAPKSVGSRITDGQMKTASKGEFDGFPGRRDQPRGSTRQSIQSHASSHPPQETSGEAHLYSVLKQHMSLFQAKRPKRPNQHRTIFQMQKQSVISKDTTINHN